MFCCVVLTDVLILRSKTAELAEFVSVLAAQSVRALHKLHRKSKTLEGEAAQPSPFRFIITDLCDVLHICLLHWHLLACFFVASSFTLFWTFCFRLYSMICFAWIILVFIILSFSLSLPSLYLFIFHPYFPPSSSSSSSNSLLPSFLPSCPFHLTRALSPPSRHCVQQHQLYHLAGKLAPAPCGESERRPGGL